MPSDEAKETRKQLTELGNLAGFHIRKWILNEPDVTDLQKKIELLRQT